MTKLPEKAVLDGTRMPKTTTGEMKSALGKLRDYLNELLGEDSTDKEAARLALGIDLAELAGKIEAKADQNAMEGAVETAVQNKVDKTELESLKQTLKEEIAKSRIPIGTIVMFTASKAPAGYLPANGAAVSRTTYPDLFATIGTTYGAGDGTTTFNLPNLIGRFAEGSTTPGEVKEAGLPNVTGNFGTCVPINHTEYASGAFRGITVSLSSGDATDGGTRFTGTVYGYTINASYSSPVYGRSGTVQPPSVTLLPCIRALN